MGIRKKIILGFILIGVLLAMSGILSSIELAKLNRNTIDEVKENKELFTLSKQLLESVQQKNSAFVRSIRDTLDVYDSIIIAAEKDIDSTFLRIKSKERELGYLLRIEAANARYDSIIKKKDNISLSWYIDVYSPSYFHVTTEIKNFMISLQNSFQQYSEVWEQNVYRALMVGIIALIAGILLLVAFYYMIHTFFLSPVLKMEKSLRDFLRANIPYSVKVDTKDEIHDLSENLEELCARAKRKE